jgi:hypothetical protein
VLYFFDLPTHGIDTHRVAMIKLFSPADYDWYRRSHGVYLVCEEGTEEDLTVVLVKNIHTLVAMVPDHQRGPGMWCAVRKPGCTANRTAIDGEDQNPGEDG